MFFCLCICRVPFRFVKDTSLSICSCGKSYKTILCQLHRKCHPNLLIRAHSLIQDAFCAVAAKKQVLRLGGADKTHRYIYCLWALLFIGSLNKYFVKEASKRTANRIHFSNNLSQRGSFILPLTDLPSFLIWLPDQFYYNKYKSFFPHNRKTF